MRIPGYELHNRHIVTYGAGGMELDPGVAEPGCPALYKARYEEKRVPWIDRMPLSYGNSVHQALYLMEEDAMPMDDALRQAWQPSLDAARYDEALRDLRNLIERGGVLSTLHTVAVEQKLTARLYEDEDFGPIEYGGIIDHIGVQETVDVEPILWVTDYKTDRSPPSRAKVQGWRQGIGYAWLVWKNRESYLPGVEGVKVIGLYDAVKWYAIPIEYPVERLEVWREWAISVARTILRDEKGRENLNPGCTWCPIRADCRKWNQLPGDGETLVDRLTEKPMTERAAELEKAKLTKNRLTALIKDTEEDLRAHIEAAGPLPVGKHEWFLDLAESRVPDVESIAKIMGADFWLSAKVTLKDVEAWVQEHPEKRADIERAIRMVPARSRLKTREIDGGD